MHAGPVASVFTYAMSLRRSTRIARVALSILLLSGLGTVAVAQEERGSFILLLRERASEKELADLAEGASRSLSSSVSVRPLLPAPQVSERALLSASRLDRYVVVEGGKGSVASLARRLGDDPRVELVLPNHRYHLNARPNDSLVAEQWALERIETEKAWDVTTGSRDVIVGFVDTGLDYLHPDLVDGIAVNAAEDRNGNGRFDPWSAGDVREGVAGDLDGIDQDGNGYADDVIGFDFVDQTVPNLGDWVGRDADPMDEVGHGTQVAGVIGARANNRIGVAGVAPGVTLLPLRAFDATGNGDDDDIAAAIVYAVRRGVRVLNLSFGDYYDSPLLHDAIRYAWSNGVTVVASSGNEGVSDPHYPSSFPEVISVGATNREDFISLFSSFGSQMSLAAPGSDILTTAPGAAYRRLSGTSFSSPYVAGVAALIASLHPEWGPEEIRATLELSADDRGKEGWDPYYGAGRLNAARAVAYPGAPAVTVIAPSADDGLSSDSSVAVVGTAFSPLLEEWDLSVGAGAIPDEWRTITPWQREGRVRDTLGIFSTSMLENGLHTLRVRLRQTNGRETERRIPISIGPVSVGTYAFDTGLVWRYDRRAYSIVIRTAELCEAVLMLRPAGSSAEYREVALEPERSGRRRLHHLLLTEREMEAGKSYEYYIRLIGARKEEPEFIGRPDRPLTALRPSEGFPLGGFSPRPYTLPYGYLLDETADFDGDGRPSVVLNRFGADGDFGPLMVYRFDGSGFIPRDSVAERYAPRAIGDPDGDGRRGLLAQAFGGGILYEQKSSTSSPFASVAYRDSSSGEFYASNLADLDGDGRDEIIARTSNESGAEFYVARLVDGRLERIATLPNSTNGGAGAARSYLGPPVTVVRDFNGDGRPDILFGDEDGDFMIYERNTAGEYRLAWVDESGGTAGSEFVAAGDIDGDGKAEAIVGYHSRLVADPGTEYEPLFWRVRLFRFNGNDWQQELLMDEQFAYVRPTGTLRSGVGAGNLDGAVGDEVALMLFPNLYLFRWDATARRMLPLWYRGDALGNRPLIADIDGDGNTEIGVGNGAAIRFHGIDTTALHPRPPVALRAIALDEDRILLSWGEAEGAESYRLYRARGPFGGQLTFTEIAVTADRSLLDTGLGLAAGRLDSGVYYHYIVTALADGEEGGRSGIESAFTHVPIVALDALGIDGRSFMLRLSGDVAEELYRPGALEVRDESGGELEVATVLAYGERELLVSLRQPAPGATLLVRPTWLFADRFGTPADTSAVVRVTLDTMEGHGARFIASRAEPIGPTTIAVQFSEGVDPAGAEDPARYELGPIGRVTGARVDPRDPLRVLLDLDPTAPLGPTGRNYVVTVRGISSLTGREIGDGAGSSVGFTIAAEELDDIFVFPHPFSLQRDGSVTFGGLVREATVEIYTQSGVRVREMKSTEGNGGLTWDGRDEWGTLLLPGVYLWMVRGENDQVSPLRKLAIVP